MKTYQKLNRFPLGAIRAEGYLKEQMERGKAGICGHLHELEPKMIADPFIKKSYVDAWKPENQAGWGAEISGNYWSGYIQFAYTLADPEMIATAVDWVDTMLKNQQANGYLGTYTGENDDIFDDYNAWGTACAMRGLIAFYEATGRKDVLEAVHRCMLWFCDTWSGDRKTCYGGPYIIEPMVFTYYHTGDERLIRYAEEYLEFVCSHDIFENSYRSMLRDEYHYNSNHTAGLGVTVRLPALVYSVTGRKEYLEATSMRIRRIREKSVQLSGSPVSVAEYLGPVSATTECEYCNYAFFNEAYSYMSYITGDPAYGDHMEEMFYNGAQGARKKDEKAIAYFNAPNQIYATESSSTSYRDMQVYAPCYPTSCCPVNAVAVVPEFIRGMLLHDDTDNLYVMAYGPCSLHHGGTDITVKTFYPFRNRALFEINCQKEFTLHLKVPAWSKGCSVTVNGETLPAEAERGFIAVRRQWQPGDTVEITFEAELRVIKVDDSDAAGKFPLAIKYGALLFAYHIPEIWKPIPGRPMTPLPEGWSWFNVYPGFEEADVPDKHEMLGLRKYQYTWNVALDETLTAADFQIEECAPEGYVWSHPMIRLHTHCYKAPYMCAPYETKTLEPAGAYQDVTEKLPLTLVPYGCTNLRITYFPKAKLK